ncbi:uncharacterized protein LOC142620730 [Castanea sativa]|uniref:uncharacterized protein LOC142620730 n=1 Tax=Castanea sativa TaxID=21020 RepID=UPI003F64AC80
MNKVSKDVKTLYESHNVVLEKVKTLAESNNAMNEELSRLQEDLEKMTEEGLQSLDSIKFEEQIKFQESTTIVTSRDVDFCVKVGDDIHARYFPRCNFLEATESPNCSYAWKSMVVALPVLKNRCGWRVGNGESIKVYLDKWIPKCSANRILHWGQDADREMLVSELIDTELNGWRCDTILEKFCEEKATAICKIPLSRRNFVDSMVWMHTKHGKYFVKSGYHLARKVIRNDDGVGSSVGAGGQQIWKKLWQLHVPNKIKIFGWKACQNILPTQMNLARRKIISKMGCQCCTGVPESAIHAILECGVAQDMWAGCAIRLQKCTTDFPNIMALFKYILDRFSAAEMEEFLIQAWFIGIREIAIVHGGQMRDPKWLNQRAVEYLDEYQNAQTHINISHTKPQTGQRWKPPLSQLYKLNFDVAVCAGIQGSGFGAVIKNSAGFAKLIIEGDNVAVMKAVASTSGDHSLLGHVYEDIKCSIHDVLINATASRCVDDIQ